MAQTAIKTLVTGANGMLGTALCNTLRKHGYKVLATDINTSEADIEYLDVTDKTKVIAALERFRPAIVFHLAAETDVDKCEKEIEHAYLVNTIGTENVALACQQMNLLMIYISTAAIFDGKKKRPYTEFDRPNPLSIYAKSKFAGENILRHFLKKYFIVRAGWMIGGVDKDKKFVVKIIKQLQSQKEVLAVTDKIGSPTFTKDFSKGLLSLIETERYGLYHMANKGSCSRYDIAKMIVKFMGRDDVIVKPVTSEMFPLRAPRPDSEAIKNFKLDLLGMNNMPSWEKALEEYISVINNSGGITKLK